ncbi:hypothetical protein NP493_1110g00016 [Ridgeia piscesae]|uniref:Uncharacterized protein n=1 Tax=Ridgeia piscesae TaxID=27915 RepID=A0AAD9KH00_RIDPI|nr:hypothetical protein NP493_1110g00016 [Ridgeia piscesae]
MARVSKIAMPLTTSTVTLPSKVIFWSVAPVSVALTCHGPSGVTRSSTTVSFLSRNLTRTSVGNVAPSCCCVFFHSATICVGLRSSSLLSVLLAAVSRSHSMHCRLQGALEQTLSHLSFPPQGHLQVPLFGIHPSVSPTHFLECCGPVCCWSSQSPASGLESGSLPEETCCNSDTRLLVDYATE